MTKNVKTLDTILHGSLQSMICQQVTLSGDAEWPKVADAVIEAEDSSLKLCSSLQYGLDHGIGHFMIFEVDLEAQAPAPPMPKWLRTSSAASDRRTVLPLSSRQAG
jgi:hypothetical protein